MFNKNKRFLILSIIFVTLAVISNGFIIYQSCLNGIQSTSWSSPIADSVADIINSVVDGTITEENIDQFSLILRKLVGHFGLFLFDGILTTLAVYFSSSETLFYKKYQGIFASMGLGVLLAITTELLQGLQPERSPQFTDCLIDIAGYFISFIIIYLILRKIEKKKIA